MKATIDLLYVLLWVKYYDNNQTAENKKQLDFIIKMAEICIKPDLLAGRPRWYSPNRLLLKKYGLDQMPAIDDDLWSTWCIYFVFYVLSEYKIETKYATHEKGIGYTSADTMLKVLVENTIQNPGHVRELTWQEAQEEANDCNIVIIASGGMPLGGAVGPGHVAVLAPLMYPVKNQSQLTCCQAGAKNGFYPVTQIFNKNNLVTDPRYFLIA